MWNFLILIVAVFLINKVISYNQPVPYIPDPNSMVAVIESTEQFKEVIAASNLVVVDFFATWCNPCKMIAPMLEKMSQEYSSASFYKVDVDQLPEVSSSNEVTAMPTILFFKNGELVGRVIGANVAAIKQALAKLA